MAFHALFVKLREGDDRPIPVRLPVQIAARTTDEVKRKLMRLASTGPWPAGAEAVRIFEDGREIDSFVPVRERDASAA